MSTKEQLKKFWDFLKEDSWQSWIISLILIFILIKWILFPTLTLITGSPLPLVVIESCSMYHSADFNEWWSNNAVWYESRNISKEQFLASSFSGGLDKGDIILVINKGNFKIGDVLIFNSQTQYPIIHRMISSNPIETKGDHNSDQLQGNLEKNIQKENIIGKAYARIPLVGWLKLIFYEPLRPQSERGFCQ